MTTATMASSNDTQDQEATKPRLSMTAMVILVVVINVLVAIAMSFLGQLAHKDHQRYLKEFAARWDGPHATPIVTRSNVFARDSGPALRIYTITLRNGERFTFEEMALRVTGDSVPVFYDRQNHNEPAVVLDGKMTPPAATPSGLLDVIKAAIGLLSLWGVINHRVAWRRYRKAELSRAS